MNKLKETQKKEAKKIIFNTALELFRNNGYENTSIQAICTSCGIAKGTFYNYFNSKEDIIRESFRNSIDDFIVENMASANIPDYPVEALHTFINVSLEYCNNVGRKTTSLAYICNLNSSMSENTNVLYDSRFDILSQIIDSGIENNIWKSNLNKAEYIDLVTALINGLMIEYCFSLEDYNIIEKNSNIIITFINHL